MNLYTVQATTDIIKNIKNTNGVDFAVDVAVQPIVYHDIPRAVIVGEGR